MSTMNSELIEQYDLSKIILITVVGSTGFFTWGYTNSISNSILPFLRKSIFPEKSTQALSLVASIISIGAAGGALFGSKIADKFGRRYSLLISDIVFTCGLFLTLLQDFELILLGRLIQGVIIGIYFTVGPLYLIEMSPKSVRGVTGTLNFFVLNLANCAAFVMGYWFPSPEISEPHNQIWRWAFALCSIPLVTRIIILVKYLPIETPYYLVSKFREEEAKEVLQTIIKGSVDTTLVDLLNDRTIQQNKNQNIGVRDLFNLKFRNAFLTGIIVAILFQLSGLSAMMVFPGIVFQAGLDPSDKTGSIMSIIMGVVNIFSKLAATVAVQKFGRRPPLVYGLLFTAIIMFFYSILVWVDSPSNMIAKVLMMIWPFPFSLSVGGMALLYVSEILPGIGISLSIQGLWISSFLIVQNFLFLVSWIGLGGVFMCFAFFSFSGAAYLYFFAVETKGKAKNEIILELMERGPFKQEHVDYSELYVELNDRIKPEKSLLISK